MIINNLSAFILYSLRKNVAFTFRSEVYTRLNLQKKHIYFSCHYLGVHQYYFEDQHSMPKFDQMGLTCD